MVQPSRILGLPTYPVLRPGSRVVRRDESHLQVGVDPPHRTVLPDVEEVRQILSDLRRGHIPRPHGEVGFAALRALMGAELVVPHHPSQLGSGQFGGSVAERFSKRAQASLEVLAVSACTEWAQDVREVAERSGVRVTDASTTGTPVDVTIVLGSGEVPRDQLDELMRIDAPFLVLVSRVGGVEVGPFVEPGRTACHRCVDAHRGVADPRRGLVVEQVAAHVAEFEDEPMDPLLMRWGSVWAVRDVMRRLEGEVPSTLATSYLIAPSGAPLAASWSRHPQCGCAWAADFDLVGCC